MNQDATTFAQIVNARRAVRKYEEGAPFDEQAVQRSLALAVLAPNSSNLQTWEFYRVRTAAAKAEVARLCMNQSAARTAQEMVVVVCRTDKWKGNSRRILANMRSSFSTPMTKRDQRAVEYYQRNIPLLYLDDPLGVMTLLRRILVAVKSMQGPFVRWTTHANARIITHKSAALAAQNFMLAMQAEGYATCPMEGFDEKRLKRFLKLPRAAEVSMIIATGVPADEGIYSERFRFPLEEVVFEV